MALFTPGNWFKGHTPKAFCGTAMSQRFSLDEAVHEVTESLVGLKHADLGLVFVSTDFASDIPRLLPLLKKRVGARHWIGCVGGGVIGTSSTGRSLEIQRKPALSVTLLKLPGAVLEPFVLGTDSLPDLDGPAMEWHEWVGVQPSKNKSFLLLIDPSAVGINDLISGLDYAYLGSTTVGGVVAPHNAPYGSLLFDNQIVSGAVGCAISGDWTLEAVVTKGCKPIGPVFVVEQVRSNVLLALSNDGRRDSPVACLQKVLEDLSEQERDCVKDSLCLGVEHRDILISGKGIPKSQGAFLVRNLIGVDPTNGAIAVAERMYVGQNVQFQLREATASRREVNQFLSESKLRNKEQPLFMLLMACIGRGTNLYGVENGDVDIARDAIGDVPIAGTFCNGEIGPIGGVTHIHGYTACWGILRNIAFHSNT